MSQFINTEADATDEDPNSENEKKEKQKIDMKWKLIKVR